MNTLISYFGDKIFISDTVIKSFKLTDIWRDDSIVEKYIRRKEFFEYARNSIIRAQQKIKSDYDRRETEYDFVLEMRSDMEEEKDVYDDDNGDTLSI